MWAAHNKGQERAPRLRVVSGFRTARVTLSTPGSLVSSGAIPLTRSLWPGALTAAASSSSATLLNGPPAGPGSEPSRRSSICAKTKAEGSLQSETSSAIAAARSASVGAVSTTPRRCARSTWKMLKKREAARPSFAISSVWPCFQIVRMARLCGCRGDVWQCGRGG